MKPKTATPVAVPPPPAFTHAGGGEAPTNPATPEARTAHPDASKFPRIPTPPGFVPPRDPYTAPEVAYRGREYEVFEDGYRHGQIAAELRAPVPAAHVTPPDGTTILFDPAAILASVGPAIGAFGPVGQELAAMLRGTKAVTLNVETVTRNLSFSFSSQNKP